LLLNQYYFHIQVIQLFKSTLYSGEAGNTAPNDINAESKTSKFDRDTSGDFCRVTRLAEAKFVGMISDVGFLLSGEIFVCYGGGISICDRHLKRLYNLTDITLPGGADVMADGRFVVVDRHSDTVNVFSSGLLLDF